MGGACCVGVSFFCVGALLVCRQTSGGGVWDPSPVERRVHVRQSPDGVASTLQRSLQRTLGVTGPGSRGGYPEEKGWTIGRPGPLDSSDFIRHELSNFYLELGRSCLKVEGRVPVPWQAFQQVHCKS